ncbi:SHOCT domain-containing protein [Flammeovirga aprica]|uniref:SHOCT domain-containing protein n=1 Tax=Flammeovirga aprica JL-4 TaxID=694437 RepID=A0A7X9RWM0_9BACT|nr:SHOCT domain-containing protein [Flammeovirga aprica]NME70055.1 SHOCT domain-containing protein [Flammeovirga aprica JL-4]
MPYNALVRATINGRTLKASVAFRNMTSQAKFIEEITLRFKVKGTHLEKGDKVTKTYNVQFKENILIASRDWVELSTESKSMSKSYSWTSIEQVELIEKLPVEVLNRSTKDFNAINTSGSTALESVCELSLGLSWEQRTYDKNAMTGYCAGTTSKDDGMKLLVAKVNITNNTASKIACKEPRFLVVKLDEKEFRIKIAAGNIQGGKSKTKSEKLFYVSKNVDQSLIKYSFSSIDTEFINTTPQNYTIKKCENSNCLSFDKKPEMTEYFPVEGTNYGFYLKPKTWKVDKLVMKMVKDEKVKYVLKQKGDPSKTLFVYHFPDLTCEEYIKNTTTYLNISSAEYIKINGNYGIAVKAKTAHGDYTNDYYVIGANALSGKGKEEGLLVLQTQQDFEGIVNNNLKKSATSSTPTTKNTASSNNADSKSLEDKLIQLKSFYEKGLITEEEYNKKRQELLSNY